MKIYIDCDGVILDTETGLFDQYYQLKESNPNLKKLQYLQEMDWERWLKQAKILGNSIEILKYYNPKDIYILTKVHSLQEATAKIKFFRSLSVKNDIIIVPNEISKSSMVEALGNILIDDGNKNLEEWKKCGGISLYYGNKDSRFTRITSIEDAIKERVIDVNNVYYEGSQKDCATRKQTDEELTL